MFPLKHYGDNSSMNTIDEMLAEATHELRELMMWLDIYTQEFVGKNPNWQRLEPACLENIKQIKLMTRVAGILDEARSR